MFLALAACSGLGGPSAEFSGPHQKTIQSLDLSDDGTLLATGGQDRVAKVWMFPGLEGVRDLPREDFVVAVAFSPDGTRLATGGYDDAVTLWDTASWEPTGTIPRAVFALDWQGDRLVLAVKGENRAEIWNTATYVLEHTLEGHVDTIHSVALSSDGSRVATGSKDDSARLWDAATGEPLGMFAGHQGVVLALAFSADGTRLATGSSDKTARIWDVATQEPIRQMAGHRDWIVGVDFSPDDRALVTVGRDGWLRLWDVGSGGDIGKIDLELGALEDVQFAGPDTVVAVGEDVFVRPLGDMFAGYTFKAALPGRPLDDRCHRLVACGKSLLADAATNDKGVDVVRMAREMNVESPEMCLNTLLGLGGVIDSALPAECTVTE